MARPRRDASVVAAVYKASMPLEWTLHSASTALLATAIPSSAPRSLIVGLAVILLSMRLHMGQSQMNVGLRSMLWQYVLAATPWVSGVGVLILNMMGAGASLQSDKDYDMVSAAIALPLFLMVHQRMAPRMCLLGACGHLLLLSAFAIYGEPIARAITILVRAAAILACSAVTGCSINSAEDAAIEASIKLALQPAEAALRLATYEKGQLAPIIDWTRVELRERVGAGVFGTVFRAKYAGSAVAAKVVHQGRATPKFLIHECKLMLTLRHPNVLTTLGLVSDGVERHAILMELMQMSLARLLTSPEHGARLTWKSPLVSIALQVARGMAYLHERQIIHGDLKPANVLLGGRPPEGLFVKLADFGEAKRVEQSPNVGGGGYSGGGGISKRADVWAFGGILAHLEARQEPFNPAPPMPFYYGVLKGEITPSWPHDVQELALRCALGQAPLPQRSNNHPDRPSSSSSPFSGLDGVVEADVLKAAPRGGIGGGGGGGGCGLRRSEVGGPATSSPLSTASSSNSLPESPRSVVSFRDCAEILTRVATSMGEPTSPAQMANEVKRAHDNTAASAWAEQRMPFLAATTPSMSDGAMVSSWAAPADSWGNSSRMDRALKLMAKLAGTLTPAGEKRTLSSTPDLFAQQMQAEIAKGIGGGSDGHSLSVSRESSLHGGVGGVGGGAPGAAISREGSVRGGISREGSFCSSLGGGGGGVGGGPSSPTQKFVRRHSGGASFSNFEQLAGAHGSSQIRLPVTIAGATPDALRPRVVEHDEDAEEQEDRRILAADREDERGAPRRGLGLRAGSVPGQGGDSTSPTE